MSSYLVQTEPFCCSAYTAPAFYRWNFFHVLCRHNFRLLNTLVAKSQRSTPKGHNLTEFSCSNLGGFLQQSRLKTWHLAETMASKWHKRFYKKNAFFCSHCVENKKGIEVSPKNFWKKLTRNEWTQDEPALPCILHMLRRPNCWE